MTPDFSDFTARLRRFISHSAGGRSAEAERAGEFAGLALELFALQMAHNVPYRRFGEARHATPHTVTDWRQIPAVPTSAFKELELTGLPPAERTVVFHSSGTTAQRPSRHFHNAESLAVYEASLLAGFRATVLADWSLPCQTGASLVCLTPPADQARHSSLVHMFETVRRAFGAADSVFLGRVTPDGAWELDFSLTTRRLEEATEAERPVLLLGTAFSLVHLVDHLEAAGRWFALPAGSRVMETGGYKGRSRSLPKPALHALLAERLGVPPAGILCEYGMSELSSQAYDRAPGQMEQGTGEDRGWPHSPGVPRPFHFPPWARAQVISPETGREVGVGETGLLRVFDLANVFSVLAIQTEDLAIRRADGFELLGRPALAEPRGCSLMTAGEPPPPAPLRAPRFAVA